MLSLPLSGSGLFSNGGGPGSTGLLSSNENLLTWLGDTVIPVLFQDAVCGDGKCDAPEEEKGYGRFGWSVISTCNFASLLATIPSPIQRFDGSTKLLRQRCVTRRGEAM